jgi:hypothetical protein
MGDYGLVNELIKFIWKYTHLDIFFIYILQGKKSSIQQKVTNVKNTKNEPLNLAFTLLLQNILRNLYFLCFSNVTWPSLF